MKNKGFWLWLSLVFSALLSHTAAAETAVGMVLATAGTVSIQRNGQTTIAERKTHLAVGDEIHTGDNARAQLRFADGTITTLGGNTAFVIKQFAWAPKAEKAPNATFVLLTGAFRTVTGKILDASGSTFGVNTPVGTIGIRGTDFWGGYLEGDAVDVLLIDGTHAVEVSNTTGKAVLEKPGQGVTLKSNQAPLAVKTWPATKVNRAVATITWPDGSTPPTQL